MEITKNDKARRFEATVNGGGTAFLRYHIEPGIIHLLYVEVPPEVRGHGIAGELTKGVLDYAAQHELKVVPVCGYVVAYLERHPEYAPLLAK